MRSLIKGYEREKMLGYTGLDYNVLNGNGTEGNRHGLIEIASTKRRK
jgi:hypothetical protein